MASAAKVFGAGLAVQGRCEAYQVLSQGRDKRLCRLQALVRHLQAPHHFINYKTVFGSICLPGHVLFSEIYFQLHNDFAYRIIAIVVIVIYNRLISILDSTNKCNRQVDSAFQSLP